jgi:quinol monooxygenase YgiN
MLVVHVFIHVLPEHLDAFIAASEENARASLQEPGVARFDLLRSEDDPTRFILVEAYLHAEAPAAHKATAHYARWRDTVAPMMASPRTNSKWSNLYPDNAGYAMSGK